MINLLPPATKQEYRYARRNTRLLRKLALFGIGLGGLMLICLAGVMYLQREASVHVARAEEIQQSLEEQNQAEIEKKVKDISGSLKLAVQVLSEEVLFSKLLKQLAVITPSNASLSNLRISELTGGLDLTASTADYNAATQLQVNLTDPENQIFEKADIVSISCVANTSSQTASKYPCTVIIRALFAKDNPFLFINNKAEN
jgi:hypothetical protein